MKASIPELHYETRTRQVDTNVQVEPSGLISQEMNLAIGGAIEDLHPDVTEIEDVHTETFTHDGEVYVRATVIGEQS